MKYRIFSILIVLAICVQALVPSAAATVSPTQAATQQEITDALLSLQDEYPDGMTWTNHCPGSAYVWVFPGTIVSMSGCAAFAAILQDHVFGDAPITWQRITKNCPTTGIPECSVSFSWEMLWPGDILQLYGHTVIVLKKYADHITVAEGNNGGKIRWGRTITKEGVSTAAYVLTRYTKTEPLMPFTDLPERWHWSHDSIEWAILHNVAAPISATSFAPTANCTRADMMQFLWAAFGRPEPQAGAQQFSDIPASASYYKAVLWARSCGYTGGTSPTTFSPDLTCSRAQALTFLWRAAESPDANLHCQFDDVSPDSYFFSSVAWATEHHITCGTSPTTFSPEQTITRAEALTFLYHAKGPQT